MSRRHRWRTWGRSLVWAALLASSCSGRTTPSARPAEPEPRASAAVRLPGFEAIEAGVLFREHELNRAGTQMRVWTYVPAAEPPSPRSRGLVLIAPAGSNLLTGMALTDSDRAEHLPYARAGYVVVAYDIDGALPDDVDRETAAAAVQHFLAARMGIDNAMTALDDSLARLPEIDPGRIFCAGHSSAGTLALQVAAHDTRIRGVIAFAPVSDLPGHLQRMLGEVDASDPLAKLVNDMSPSTLAPRLHHAFLFHAAQDRAVPLEQTRALQAAIVAAGGDSKLASVPGGDHYDSMIEVGIPLAIEWLGTQR